MTDRQNEFPDRPQDQLLRYALRVLGLAVVLGSTFFLMKSITLDPVVNGLFGISAGLGFIILVAGWMPGERPVRRLAPTPALEPVAHRRRN